MGSVLLLYHIGFPDVITNACLPVYAAPYLRVLCKLLHLSPWNCNSCNAYSYIHTGNDYTCTQTEQVQQPYSTYLVQVPSHGTSVTGVMNMGNTVPRVGLKCTSLAFQASVLTLHHIGFPDVTTILTPTCICSSLPQRPVQTTTVCYMLACRI